MNRYQTGPRCQPRVQLGPSSGRTTETSPTQTEEGKASGVRGCSVCVRVVGGLFCGWGHCRVTCQLRPQRTQALRAGLAVATSNLVTVLPPARRDVKVPSQLPHH